MCLETLAAIAAVASIGGTAYNLYSSQKSASAQKKANALQLQQQELQNAREKRQALREAIIRTGQVEQGAANQGATTSSAVSGGIASIESQLAGNIGFLDEQANISGQITNQLNKASQYSSNAQTVGAIASAGATIFNAAGGPDYLKGLFSSGSSEQPIVDGIALPTRRPVL